MRKQALLIAFCYVGITSAQKAGVSFDVTPMTSTDTTITILKEVEVTSAVDSKIVTSNTPYQKIDSDQLSNRGVTDISDAVRRLAGTNLRDYGGAGGMKTVSVRGLGATHTAVVYDGVALSDSQTGEIDLSRYSLDNVSSISLFSGENEDIFIPARASASSNSLFINSFNRPDFYEESFKGKFQFTFGGYGYYNPFLRLEGRAEKVDLLGNVEYINARNDYPFKLKNGNIITREKRQNSQMNSWKGEINARWNIRNATSLCGKLYFYDNARHLPGPVIYYVSESKERLRDRNFFGQLNFRSRLHDKISIAAVTKFNWSSTRYQDESGKYPDGRLDDYYIQREVYASGALLYLPLDGLSLDYSADWFFNNLTSSSSRNAVSPYRNAILQSVAAKYNIGRFSLLGKVLYSIYLNGAKSGDAGKNSTRLSPSMSVSWNPFDETGFYVRASYKNIFRMPTFNEAYFNNYGSLNLEPEITDQFNLGFTYEQISDNFLSNIIVTLDGYYNIVSNKIVALPYNMFLWTMSNLGKVNVKGSDMTISGTLRLNERNNILFSGSYSYQRAEVRTSPDRYDWKKQVAYLPLNSGAASLTWENPWVEIVFHATASGSRYTTTNNLPETKLPGYVDGGVTLLKKVKIGKYLLSGRVDILNVFNAQYEIVARYPMPGRTWKCSVSFDF